MESLIEKINEILAKGPKIGKQQTKEVAVLLWSLYNETHDAEQAADLLMQLPPAVTQAYFELADSSFSQEETMESAKALVKNTRFNDNKSDSALYRGFAAAGVLIKSEKSIAAAAEIVSKLLTMVEKKGGFSRRCIDLFEENIARIYKEELTSLKASWNEPRPGSG